jgi:hypothetical protein
MSKPIYDPEAGRKPSGLVFFVVVMGGLFIGSALFCFCSGSIVMGLCILVGGINFGTLFISRRSKGISYNVSGARLLASFAMCGIPPLLLLVIFGDRPGWFGPLLTFFLLSVGGGPLLLLRRYARYPETEQK